MRMKVLVALCGGALIFAYGALREGSRVQAAVMFAIIFIIMGIALWFQGKNRD